MTLPNFLIIGAAKAATTSLASLLETHPQAAIVTGKEPHFFSHTPFYNQGIQYYQKGFSHCTTEQAIGDASTSYSRIRKNPLVIERIKEHLVDPKIIYMVRHPIKRIESAYIEQMTVEKNNSIQTINEAIYQLPMLIDSSRYWETYSAYRNAFGENNIHIVWFDEYTNQTKKVFSQVCDFLKIDSSIEPKWEHETSNSRADTQGQLSDSVKTNSRWDKKTLREVKKTLKHDTQKFLIEMGQPLNYWE